LIYLIKKLWCDSLENDSFLATGYEVVGYVKSERKAKSLCEKGGTYTGTGWPIERGKIISKYIYEEVDVLKGL
jgi:hypothetical protein